ncbi:MAG: MFS transporter [Chloroflexi bacterium]|nr:MFS transporter [Chloroflexota bacterium]
MSSQTTAAFPWKRNLAVLWAVQVLTTLGFSFTFPFYPIFFQELGVEGAESAAFWSGASGWMMGVGMGIFAPIWGLLGDRYGRKLNIIRAMTLAGVLMVLSGYAQTPAQLLISRFFVGAASGVVPTIMALVASHTPRPRLPFATGVTMSGLYLGIAIGPVFGGLIFDALGARAAFWATGVVLLVGVLLVVVFAREEFSPEQARGRGVRAPLADLWRMATARTFLPLLAVLILVHGATMLVYPAVPGIVAAIGGGEATATASGVVFMASGVASAVSAVLMGWLAGRIGLRKVVMLAASAAAVAALVPFFADTLLLLVVGMAAMSLFAGGLGGIVNGMIALRAPRERQSAAFGAAQTAHSVAISIGPLLGGASAVAFGLRSVYLLDIAAFGLVVVVAAVFLGGASRVEQEDEAQRQLP